MVARNFIFSFFFPRVIIMHHIIKKGIGSQLGAAWSVESSNGNKNEKVMTQCTLST